MDITLPHNGWTPRPHQIRLWRYLHEGGKRAIAIWHRRAGKDDVCLHHAAVSAAQPPAKNLWHCLPEYEQARKAIWSAVNPHTGRRRIDEAFPPEIRASTNDSTMFIRFKTGSTWQCVGSDRYDSTVGSGPAGIVYSEFALQNPSAWAYHRPMLEENDGWACFISTPRGHNHCKTMYEHALTRSDWFAEKLTARDTGALSQAQLLEALDEYKALYGEDMGRAAFEQEYECSFNAAVVGSLLGREMAAVRDEERIRDDVVAIEGAPVHRAWDLGMTDDTSIWFWQVQGGQIAILDCYSSSGVGLEHYAEMIEAKHKQYGWEHGDDCVPHDAMVKEMGTGKTRVETMAGIGLHPLLVPWATMQDGLNAARRALPLCVFHSRCQDGINALEQYQREWNDELKTFRANPLHNWASHYADAFRYLAQAWREAPRRVISPPLQRGWVIPPPSDRSRRGGLVI
jgi:phage terminase large subunit